MFFNIKSYINECLSDIELEETNESDDIYSQIEFQDGKLIIDLDYNVLAFESNNSYFIINCQYLLDELLDNETVECESILDVTLSNNVVETSYFGIGPDLLDINNSFYDFKFSSPYFEGQYLLHRKNNNFQITKV